MYATNSADRCTSTAPVQAVVPPAVSSRRGRVGASACIAQHGIAYAGPFHKLYVSDERGKAEAVVDVRFRRLEDVPVEEKVHSLAVDVRTHRVYLPEQQEHGQAVAKMIVFDAVVGDAATGHE